MIWNTHVNAWKTTDAVSRLLQMNTSSRMTLVAMIVCPTTTPTNDTILMTSIARSRVAGVFGFDLGRAGEQHCNRHAANLGATRARVSE